MDGNGSGVSMLSDQLPIHHDTMARTPTFTLRGNTISSEGASKISGPSPLNSAPDTTDKCSKITTHDLNPGMENRFDAIFMNPSSPLLTWRSVTAVLDTFAERNIISRPLGSVEGLWKRDNEAEIEKQRPFLGRRGQFSTATRQVTLKWRPEGSQKWMETSFSIVESEERFVALGKEFVDFQGIFHDLDIEAIPLRLPGRRLSRGRLLSLEFQALNG
jgi:hypothetical protein